MTEKIQVHMVLTINTFFSSRVAHKIIHQLLHDDMRTGMQLRYLKPRDRIGPLEICHTLPNLTKESSTVYVKWNTKDKLVGLGFRK